jgi:mannitol-1-/sugar-/sorbitol-6-/2-deoxyglucose-6-phosphatase
MCFNRSLNELIMVTFRLNNQNYYGVKTLTPEPGLRNYIISLRINQLFIFATSKFVMLDTVIFDMDGLLIDSEPLWQKAGMQTLTDYGISITLEQYHETTGLRTPEWIEWWFTHYDISIEHAAAAITAIEEKALSLIEAEGEAFEGTEYILDFFKKNDFTIGLATSSPLKLVEVVVRKLGIKDYFKAFSSAEGLAYGKPHPQVYINCAEALGVKPVQCVCFEDSFNGMISAKAAKMKCVVIPAQAEYEKTKWNAADLRIPSLNDFNALTLQELLTA